MELLLIASGVCGLLFLLALFGFVMAGHARRREMRELNLALANLEAPVSIGAQLYRSRIRANWLVTDDPAPEPSFLDRLDGARWARNTEVEITTVPRNEDNGMAESTQGAG